MKTMQRTLNRGGKVVALMPLAWAVALNSITAAEAGKAPTLAVAKTEASQVAAWQPAMGEGLAHMLITELVHLPNFRVLESVALDDLRAERGLGETGEVSAEESVKKGQWKGADYIFKSTVTRFGAKEQTFGGSGFLPIPRIPKFLPILGNTGVEVKNRENEVQIDWHITDSAGRDVVASGLGQGKEKGTSFNFQTWQGGGFSDNSEFMDSALGKADEGPCTNRRASRSAPTGSGDTHARRPGRSR